MLGLSTLVSRIIMGLVAALLIIGLFQIRSCTQARQKAAEARLNNAQGKAAHESAKDAITTQGAAAAREQASEQMTADNTKEITNAKGAEVVLHPDVAATGRRKLCGRAAYRDRPECRVQ
ncbi:MAG TPA: hypothetical protein VF655_10005 [Allosphingosinicella sp.]|jgi:hypothetical protein